MLLLQHQYPKRKNRCCDLKEIRNQQVKFVVNETERQLIKRKMKSLGIENTSAYLRKMAIDGYIVNFDIPEISELITLLRRAGNNINQLAKKVNSTNRIYANEIKKIQNFQEAIWKNTDLILKKLSLLE